MKRARASPAVGRSPPSQIGDLPNSFAMLGGIALVLRAPELILSPQSLPFHLRMKSGLQPLERNPAQKNPTMLYPSGIYIFFLHTQNQDLSIWTIYTAFP